MFQSVAIFTITEILSLFLIIGPILLLKRFENVEIIQKRLPHLVIDVLIAYSFMMVLFLVEMKYFHESITNFIPCYVRVAVGYSCVPMILIIHVIRFTQFTINYFLAKAKTDSDFQIKWYEMYLFRFAKMFNKITVKKIQRTSNSAPSLKTSELMKSTSGSSIGVIEAQQLTRSQIRTLMQITCIFSTIGYFIATLVVERASFDNNKTKNCWALDNLAAMYISTLGTVVALFYICFLLRRVNDSMYIRLESFAGVSFMLFGLLCFMGVLHLPFSPFSTINDLIGPFVLAWVFCGVFPVSIFGINPLVLAYFYKKNRKNLLGFDEPSFIQVLKSTEDYEILKKHAIESFSAENILFYEELLNVYRELGFSFRIGKTVAYEFPRINSGAIEHEITKRFKEIYKHFIKEDAPNEVNIPSVLRSDLEKAIDEKRLKIDSLEAIKDEVMRSLYVNTFPRFLAEKQGKHAV
jgi:hypothetical protein